MWLWTSLIPYTSLVRGREGGKEWGEGVVGGPFGLKINFFNTFDKHCIVAITAG